MICAEVGGPNLVEKALAAMRERGWRSPPLRVEIRKRIPVAAGLGGGSADAAAVLRLARGELDGIRAVAASVGADVPSQLQPRPCVVAGAGEVVEPIPPPDEHGVVLVPQTMGLTTADVYAEADRLAQTRGEAELESIRRKLRDAVIEAPSPLQYPEHLVNDLQPAAISLRPEIGEALEALLGGGGGARDGHGLGADRLRAVRRPVRGGPGRRLAAPSGSRRRSRHRRWPRAARSARARGSPG